MVVDGGWPTFTFFCKDGDRKVGGHSFSLRTTVKRWGEIKMKIPASAAGVPTFTKNVKVGQSPEETKVPD